MAKPFVEWTEGLSVGIQEIDEQHKVLINLINRLFDETIINQAAIGVTEEILDELIQYTIVHFAVEESLFRIFDYPAIDTHMGHHADLKAQVLELQKKIKQGLAVNSELLLFLKKWLTNHILQEDKQYAPFLIKQGVKSSWGKKSWLGKIWG
ncbi:MAG: bacteriohemerythrin [Methylococcales bacterium]|nr:bacteriohemerythrin [Methylococcales bacterium]